MLTIRAFKNVTSKTLFNGILATAGSNIATYVHGKIILYVLDPGRECSCIWKVYT